MNKQTISFTTAADGSASVKGAVIIGKLYAIEYRPGTTATGATVTVTCESDSTKPLLTKASAGTANSWYYPREVGHAVANAAAITDVYEPILSGVPKVVIASGGDAKSGKVILYYE